MSLDFLTGGGSTSGRPPPPPVFPLDLAATDAASRAAGLYQWDISNKEYEKQYPGIVAAQNEQMKQLSDQLNGPLDPTLQRSFLNNAVAGSMSAFGGGRDDANVTGQGTAGRNAIAGSVASQTQGYQDDIRNQMRNMISQYPQANMPDPRNVLRGATTNLTNQISANSQAAGYQAANQAAQSQADAQGTATAVGAGSAIASSALSAYLSSAIASGAISW